MTKHSIDFSYFLESLETFENLLHAETQAIAAKHLDTIEEIIDRKDEGLRLLLDSKGKLGIHGDEASMANEMVEQVLDLQEKNAESFRRLFERQFKLSRGEDTEEKPREKKMRRAYLKSSQEHLPRFDS